MWVFCCGMMRAGSTLQFQVTAQLVEEARLGRRVEWVQPHDFPALRKKYSSYEGWKVFKTHICTRDMEEEFRGGNAFGVYVFRDLRDVMVSAMRKNGKPFEQLWAEEFLDVCIRNYELWTGLPRVLVSKYEEMMHDLPGEVGRIAGHLGIAIDRAGCERVAAAYTLERQVARIEKFNKSLSPEKRLQRGFVFDPETLLHNDHIASGESGQWKRNLTSRQLGLIEDKAGGWLVSHGYELAGTAGQRA